MQYVRVLALGLVLLFVGLFGISILENAHNAFLRYKGLQVVKVTNEEETSGGTGSIVRGKSGKRYVLTNNHICRIAKEGVLFVRYKNELFRVRVVKSYAMNDLCVLEAPDKAKAYLELAGSFDFGDRAYVIGHPQLEPLSVTVGEMSGLLLIHIPMGVNFEKKDCSGETYELVDLSKDALANFFGILNICYRHLPANASTMNILPGNSGSPTVNAFGNIVGVAFAANDSGVRSYIVPLDAVKDFLSEL